MAVQRLIERFNLRSRLRFDIDAGQIWLDESRMLLFHAKAIGALRRELFDSLGAKRAQGLLFRMGFAAGQQDADLASKLLGEGDNFDVFQIGPELHAFEGLVKTVLMDAHIDWEQGCFFGEAKCENSWEAESHLQQFGIGEDTACWTLAGYASGYVTRFFRRFIVFRETQCTCRGDPHCVLVGKPVEAWGDDAYLEYYRPQDLEPSLRELQRELWQLRGGQREQHAPGRLVGASPGFRTAFDLLGKAARTPITVLLLGETGVGKEVFARGIHDCGSARAAPFVAVNCGGLSRELLATELFGYAEGSFTGARRGGMTGKIEAANGGTLFLDELGEMPLDMQPHLLRVLEEGEIYRLGENVPRKVKFRLICATNRDLRQEVTEGRFRMDLYYRVAVTSVRIPPLRERLGDIPVLARALMEKLAAQHGVPVPPLSALELGELASYSWPGNVRELRNVLESMLLTGERPRALMAQGSPRAPVPDPSRSFERASGCAGDPRESRRLEQAELEAIQSAIDGSHGNMALAARSLGIAKSTLYLKLKKFGLDNQVERVREFSARAR